MTPKKPGDVIDRYVVESLLGRGGMGAVYAARDTKLGRRVALKILLANADTSAHARLVREARTVAAFEHPNAVVIYDVGEVDGAPFLSMELVRGRQMRACVEDRHIPIPLRLRWLADIARALAAAHRVGIVHRDVKPDNVMIREDGVVKVLDFGIARFYPKNRLSEPGAHQEPSFATLTEEGVIVGTPLYLAPEQLVGEPIDGKVDQFAWAVMAYEMIAGQVPWSTVDRRTLTSDILTFEPILLRERVPGLPLEVERAVQRAMSKRPANRFESLDEVADILELFADAKSKAMQVPEDHLALAPTEEWSAGDESGVSSDLPRASTQVQNASDAIDASATAPDEEMERTGHATPQIEGSTSQRRVSSIESNTGKFFRIARASVVWSGRERVRASALRWMGGMLAGGIGILVFAFLSVVWRLPSWLTGILFAFSTVAIVCAGIASLVAIFGGRKPETTRMGPIEVHDDELAIPGAIGNRISKSDVIGGWIENRGSATNSDEWNVLLALRDNTEVAIAVGDRTRGDELLRAAGVSIADRVLRVPLRSAASMTSRGELLGIIALVALLALLPVAIGLTYGYVATLEHVLAYLSDPNHYAPANLRFLIGTVAVVTLNPLILFGLRALYRFLQRRTAIVGMDGVAIQRSDKREFVTYEHIKKVVRDPRGVRLELEDGKNMLLPVVLEAGVPLPITPGPGPNLDTIAAELPATLPVATPRAALYNKDVARREALVARLEQARAHAHRGVKTNLKWEQLDQRGDTLAAWKERLRRMLVSPAADAGAAPRDAAMADAELLEVVEDLTALPERRIAAAVALSTSSDEPARRRVRVAVDACADDDLRAALEAAAEGEIEESLMVRLRHASKTKG